MATPQAASIRQQLCDESALNSGTLWIAVDAGNAFAAELPAALASALDDEPSHVVPLSHPNLDPPWRPRWLRVDTTTPSGGELLQHSIEHALHELDPDALQAGQGRRIAGWLRLDEGQLAAASRHIAHEMIRSHPNRGQRLVRLHDPAVLWAVWPLLSAGQRRQLLGPIQAWTLLDPAGESTTLAAQTDAPPSAWNAELWDQVDDVSHLNTALRAIRSSRSSDLRVEHLHAIAMPSLKRARQLGFSDPRDLIAFARHAVEVHPDFDRHATLRQALATRKADDRYTALVDSLSVADWQHVRQSLLAA